MPPRADSTAVDASTQELDTFNNDVRLRGLKTVCDNLRVWQQKKALLYFSSGMQRNGVGQPGGDAGGDQRVRARERLTESRGFARTAGRGAGWRRASGQPRRGGSVLGP